jgi:uncharacterized membrane protein YtjA (UPF0391 family)
MLLSNRLNLSQIKGSETMLNWVVIFFIIALVAGVFGFTGIAAQAVGIAQILFFIFIVLFLISLILHVRIGRNGK